MRLFVFIIFIFVSFSFTARDIYFFGRLTASNLEYLLPIDYLLSEKDLKYITNWDHKSHYLKVKASSQQGKARLTFKPVPNPISKEVVTLLFSNYPERLTHEGVIFESGEINGPSKLLFFHNNVSGKNGFLILIIKTKFGRKIAFHGAVAGPDPSELFVGQALAMDYWQNQNNGFVFKNKLKKVYSIKKDTIVGGIIDLFPIDENSYTVDIYFSYTPMYKHVWGYTSDMKIFPYQKIEKTIFLDNPHRVYNLFLGKDKSLDNGIKLLEGNYGVEYNFDLVFKHTGVYELFFTANGGAAGVVFQLGNKMYQTFSSTSRKISDLVIDSPQRLRLKTFPLPGSNYPATITIRKKK